MTAKQKRAILKRENLQWTDVLSEVQPSRWVPVAWDTTTDRRIRVLRSKRFLVQIFSEANGVVRLTANRTALAKGGERWEEGISWDDLQKLKSESGYADAFAVEIYPPSFDEINVANMRHLWILPEPLEIGWKRI